jgi:hypothetical protein
MNRPHPDYYKKTYTPSRPSRGFLIGVIGVLTLMLIGVSAQAQSVYTLTPLGTCVNVVCSAPIGVDPAAPFTVDSFYDSRYRGYPTAYGITLDGVRFDGLGGDIAQAPDGRQVALQVIFGSRRTCVRSGRGQHCQTYYWPQTTTLTTYF